MQISYDDKQLFHAPQADSRIMDLKVWMVRNGVSFSQIGKALGGITGPAVQQMLKGTRISSMRHKRLLELGLPAHLLPPVQDVTRGRPLKV